MSKDTIKKEQNYIIRNERIEDFREVEELTRKAFWNLHAPGCDEHYLVHIMRKHQDFIPELDFVLELDNRIIGNIMYTKALLKSSAGEEKDILTFGPLSILPEYQRKGYGKALLDFSFNKALEMGYSAIVIFGNPGNYVSSGFKSCRKYNVHLENNIYPTAMLVLELIEGSLSGKDWVYQESSVYCVNEHQAEEFDKLFEYMPKEYHTSHEEFYIYSHSRIID